MRRPLATLLAVAVLASPVPAWADGLAAAPVVGIVPPVPAPVISPLKQGQPAPYSGVLLSPPAVAQIVAERDTEAQAIAIALQRQSAIDQDNLTLQVQTLTTTCTADKNVLQAQLTDAQKQNQVLADELKKNTGGPGAPVWIGIGVVGGIAVTLLTAYALKQL